MTEPGWQSLDAELDRWADLGRPADFWLRDDDAIEPTAALDRLLNLAAAGGAPMALAVIPALAKPALADRLAGQGSVSVLQHGYAHANHSAEGAKKSEFADPRAPEAISGELVQGRTAITRMFGATALPVLAPPWNRIAAAAVGRLRDCGFSGLSRFKPRAAAEAAPGVREINTHVDLIAWREGRRGKPFDEIAAEAAAHLAARRTGRADPDEPTGLLSHHLVMDDTAWSAFEALVRRLGRDDRACWRSAPALFGGV